MDSSSLDYDLILSLKLSSVHKSVPDLINDLRKDERCAEAKLVALDNYRAECQKEISSSYLFQEEPAYRAVVMEGMSLLQEEIKRITASAVTTKKRRTFETNKGLNLNGPFTDPELQLSNDNERQEANSSTNQAASISLDPARKAEKAPIDLNLEPNKGKIVDFELIPLTKPIWKNNRIRWTDELHARFLAALHVLGPEWAKPKQIRDLMQVDGLTTEQVKNHLCHFQLLIA